MNSWQHCKTYFQGGGPQHAQILLKPGGKNFGKTPSCEPGVVETVLKSN